MRRSTTLPELFVNYYLIYHVLLSFEVSIFRPLSFRLLIFLYDFGELFLGQKLIRLNFRSRYDTIINAYFGMCWGQLLFRLSWLNL